jgi:hypothetical protein
MWACVGERMDAIYENVIGMKKQSTATGSCSLRPAADEPLLERATQSLHGCLKHRGKQVGEAGSAGTEPCKTASTLLVRWRGAWALC